MAGHVSLNSIEYPIKSIERGVFSEFASAIREGQGRRVDRAIADFRVDGTGYLKGLGYKRGRQEDVEGGAWKCECRIEIPGQITLPLEMESETEAAGDLSGEVAAAGRLISVNTDIGNSTGKKLLYQIAGLSILATTSDSDFSMALKTHTPYTGVARYYCAFETIHNTASSPTRILVIGGEAPTSNQDPGMRFTTDPTQATPTFTDVQGSANADENPRACYWGCSIDDLQRTYAHINVSNDAQFILGTGEWLVYWTWGQNLNASVPTTIGTVNDLKAGDQIAGVIGHRIWLLTPLQDAAALPNATKTLKYIDIDRNHAIVEVPPRTRNVTWACRYDLPTGGPGIAYGDGQSAYWTNGTTHVSLNVLRHQGRDVAATIKGPNPTGDRLALLWQADTNLLAWYEEYIPERNAWYPFSKRFVTAAALILPGGTERGTTLPWGAEGLRRYFCDPAAVNSTFVRQKHYGQADRSNPLTTSVGVDDFEDGPLSSEFPMYDAWGGPEESGQLLQGYFEGDANVSADETVLWEYTLDQSTYPDYATYTAVDQTTVLASGGAAGRRFGSRCTLNRGSTATKTPNGATFVHRGLKEPSTRQRHDYVLDLSNMSQEAKEDLRSEFNTARDALSVLLEDETISTYVYVLGFSIKTVPTGEVGGREEVVGAEFSVLELL